MIHWPDGKIDLPRSIEHDFSSHAVLACEQALCLGGEKQCHFSPLHILLAYLSKPSPPSFGCR